MKKKKYMWNVNTGALIIVCNFIFWIGYNIYFGWNKTPESEAEEIFDIIYTTAEKIGILILLYPLVSIFLLAVRLLDGDLNIIVDKEETGETRILISDDPDGPKN